MRRYARRFRRNRQTVAAGRIRRANAFSVPGRGYNGPTTSAGLRPIDENSREVVIGYRATPDVSLRAGYLSVTPAGSTDPAAKARGTATLNVNRAGQTLPNHTTVQVSARGFDVFVQSGAHVVADVAGFYVGAPVGAPFGPPQNASPIPPGCLGYAAIAVSAITRGTSPGIVAIAQQRLLDLGFWNAGADGSFGLSTAQAEMA